MIFEESFPVLQYIRMLFKWAYCSYHLIVFSLLYYHFMMNKDVYKSNAYFKPSRIAQL